jgi:hypothetical protein
MSYESQKDLMYQFCPSDRRLSPCGHMMAEESAISVKSMHVTELYFATRAHAKFLSASQRGVSVAIMCYKAADSTYPLRHTVCMAH